MAKLPILGEELVELGFAFLEVFRHLSSVLNGYHEQGKEYYLCLDVIGLFAEFLHLFIVIAAFDVHLLVFTLKPFDGLLACLTLLFCMPLNPFELFLGIRELSVHSLRRWISEGRLNRGEGDNVPPFSFGVRSVQSFYSLGYL